MRRHYKDLSELASEDLSYDERFHEAAAMAAAARGEQYFMDLAGNIRRVKIRTFSKCTRPMSVMATLCPHVRRQNARFLVSFSINLGSGTEVYLMQ